MSNTANQHNTRRKPQRTVRISRSADLSWAMLASLDGTTKSTVLERLLRDEYRRRGLPVIEAANGTAQ